MWLAGGSGGDMAFAVQSFTSSAFAGQKLTARSNAARIAVSRQQQNVQCRTLEAGERPTPRSAPPGLPSQQLSRSLSRVAGVGVYGTKAGMMQVGGWPPSGAGAALECWLPTLHHPGS